MYLRDTSNGKAETVVLFIGLSDLLCGVLDFSPSQHVTRCLQENPEAQDSRARELLAVSNAPLYQ